jgi:hypothetical protein
MVWHQYVYEASHGNDVEVDSDGELVEDEPSQTVEDWEIVYSDELHMMWNTMQTLMYDAHIEHQGNFSDFVEFCYMEHDEHANFEYDERIDHIWRNLRRIVNNNYIHEDILRGATLSEFTWFLKNIMCIY